MAEAFVTPRNGRRAAALIIGAIGLSLLGACGRGGSGSQGPGRAAAPSVAPAPGPSTGVAPSSSTTISGAVDPNRPEVNEAGDIPDNQVFVDYRPPGGGYSVAVPEGWARQADGGAVTFTDKLNGIRLETVATPSVPTVASVTQTDLPPIRAAAQHFEAGTVKTVTRRAGTAVLATYRADAPPEPVTGKVVHDDVERYVFWKDGTAVVLTLSCPKGADNVDPWRIVTDSFTWR